MMARWHIRCNDTLLNVQHRMIYNLFNIRLITMQKKIFMNETRKCLHSPNRKLCSKSWRRKFTSHLDAKQNLQFQFKRFWWMCIIEFPPRKPKRENSHHHTTASCTYSGNSAQHDGLRKKKEWERAWMKTVQSFWFWFFAFNCKPHNGNHWRNMQNQWFLRFLSLFNSLALQYHIISIVQCT